MARRGTPVDPALAYALSGELIGAAVAIDRHPGLAALPLVGTIVDESLETLTIQVPGKARTRCVPKAGAGGTILLGGRPLPLSGDSLRVRPEDRPKRLLGRGRWRSP